ncbi:hypothetical protein [Micromonospora halophytica]|uniref:Uncharacterized protein n=1 Tax=Micromonospora halophytica TaxID=47864 RepID=A0A1C5H3Z3_9ACTN|nr:hypothetical protein [Micromonospora halophytica]SCG40728.1 hypothetical protein GA0070560_10351 [Micromonospora halophytica]
MSGLLLVALVEFSLDDPEASRRYEDEALALRAALGDAAPVARVIEVHEV